MARPVVAIMDLTSTTSWLYAIWNFVSLNAELGNGYTWHAHNPGFFCMMDRTEFCLARAVSRGMRWKFYETNSVMLGRFS